MTKRALALLLTIVIVVALFSGCKSKATEEVTHQLVTQTTAQIVEDVDGFKLSYSQSDSLNPYEADTLNNQIVQDLVFDSLFKLDESFEAVPEIASSYSYDDERTLRVTIVSGLKFSDGTPLTAKSVVKAFYEAKDSPYWKNSLAPISDARSESDTVIKFNLSYSNPYAHQLLTFYIANVDSDKRFPIGSGRYIFAEGDGRLYVELNKEYREDFNPRFTKIQLVNVPAADSINNALNIGNISYAFRDLSTESVTRLRCKKKQVNLNNMVYLGLRSSLGITSNANIRQAISLAVDRATLAKSAYQGYALAATSIYHPSSKIGRETVMFSNTSDVAAAKQAIAKSGYDDSRLKLTIVVNKNENKIAVAKLVKQELEAVGFSVSVKSYDQKTFNQALKYSNYDIFVGETKVPNDMRMTSFFSSSGKTRFGINQDSDTSKSYNDYLKGNEELGKFILNFNSDMPFVPVVYRKGIICYSKALHGDMQGYYGSFFSNIEDWYYN